MCEIDLRLISWFQKNSRFFFPLDQRFLRRRKRNKKLKKQKTSFKCSLPPPQACRVRGEIPGQVGTTPPPPGVGGSVPAGNGDRTPVPARRPLPRKQGLGSCRWVAVSPAGCSSFCLQCPVPLPGPPEVRETPSPLVWGTGWLSEHLPVEVLGVRAPGAQQCFQNLLLSKSHPCFPNCRVSALSSACLFYT